MYYAGPKDRKLAGFMFETASRFERGPQIGGPLTVWHYHVWTRQRCVNDAGHSSGFADRGEECPEAYSGYRRSHEMMHVWLIDHLKGPFSTDMHVGKEVLLTALEKRERERGF